VRHGLACELVKVTFSEQWHTLSRDVRSEVMTFTLTQFNNSVRGRVDLVNKEVLHLLT